MTNRNGKVSPEALEEIKQAIIALHNPGPDDVIELRAPKVNGRKNNTLSGYFDCDHLDDLARAALAIDGRVAGVYITLNPCDESLLARCANRAQEYADLTTGDKDIARRINLLIDTDPTRASGISASQEEKDAAMALLAAVREWLDLHGWPEPRVTADSGNGGHLIYAIDLPNDDDSKELIERVLKAIAQEFAAWDKPKDGRKRASVDTSVHNAARISKLYGTLAAKGDNVPKRPHRRARILDNTPDAQPVPVRLLQQVAAHLEDDTQQQRQHTNGTAGKMGKMGMSQQESTDWVKDFCERHNLAIAEEKTEKKSNRAVLRLAECPFNSDHKSPDSAITIDTNGKIGFHCFHSSCQSYSWQDVRNKFEPNRNPSTRTNGTQPPRQPASANGHQPHEQAQQADDEQAQQADDVLTTANRTDEGNAECFVSLYGDTYRYCGTRGIWLKWNGAYWQPDERKTTERAAINTARQRYHAAADIDDLEARKRAAAWAISSESQAKASATLKAAEKHLITLIDDYDTSPLLAAARNATIDLLTGTNRKPQPADMLSMALGTIYDPAATCPKWEQFISEVFSHDAELIRYVQRAVGYSLSGDTSEQKLFLCYGNGANGKSVFLDTIAALLGDYAATAAFDTFDANKRSEATNDLAMLKGKRFVTITESEQDKRLAEARVKQITGGDAITCRFLHREFFTYRPDFKIWLAMNHLPTIRGTDRGIWRRIQVIPFLENFEGRENRKLTRDLLQELPGILNWALQGLQDWHDTGLGTCPAVQRATSDYKADQDKIGRWLGECVESDSQDSVTVAALWDSYKAWCDDNNVFAGSKKAWVFELTQRGHESQKIQQKRQYIGLKLASGEAEQPDSGTDGTDGTVNPVNSHEEKLSREKPKKLSHLSHLSQDDKKPTEEQPPVAADDPPDPVLRLRLEVVSAIKCGDDDSLARLLPRLRQVSEKDYREVCAKYKLTPERQQHTTEQRE
jgi:putative DNA primase/helicase